MIAQAKMPSAHDDDRVLRQSARSWQEGYRAGQQGANLVDCPHPAGTEDSWSWSSGYIEGKAGRVESCQCRIDLKRKH